ncbi:MAG: hypothetical protein JWN76_3314 [Chitinophagaceae bacterium]|nr:hypothetical protein [Chitinophagaceae bacterium]
MFLAEIAEYAELISKKFFLFNFFLRLQREKMKKAPVDTGAH